MRQGWCIGLRLPVQLRANNHQSKKPKICLITSNKELDYPFIDQYIRYDSRGDYATHPYSLTAIADTICIEYAKMLKELE